MTGVQTCALPISFSTPFPRSQVAIGLVIYPTELFIPRPRRCFKCQRFGHVKRKCRREEKCERCGSNAHTPCSNPPFCINCKGPHSASSNKCPVYLEEEQIVRTIISERIDGAEARRRVKESRTRPLMSYAEAAASNRGRSSPARDGRPQTTPMTQGPGGRQGITRAQRPSEAQPRATNITKAGTFELQRPSHTEFSSPKAGPSGIKPANKGKTSTQHSPHLARPAKGFWTLGDECERDPEVQEAPDKEVITPKTREIGRAHV